MSLEEALYSPFVKLSVAPAHALSFFLAAAGFDGILSRKAAVTRDPL